MEENINTNMVQNPKTETPQTVDMNDYDYLFDVLNTEKHISCVLSTAVSEMSHEQLFNEAFSMLETIKVLGRECFELAFKLGWYPLEKAEMNKIETEKQEFVSKLNELNH